MFLNKFTNDQIESILKNAQDSIRQGESGRFKKSTNQKDPKKKYKIKIPKSKTMKFQKIQQPILKQETSKY